MVSTDDNVSRKREELERCPLGNDGRYEVLFHLAYALHERSRQECKIDDLNEAITLHRDALELRPVENDEYDRSASLNGLANCLSDRYEKLGAVDDLEEAITLRRETLALCPPGHVHRAVSLHNLGVYLWRRFLKKAENCDLEEAIHLLHAALELRPSGDPSLTLRSLVLCHSSRYEMQGSVKDLEEIVAFGRAGLGLRPWGHPGRDIYLHDLARYLRETFVKTAVISDLEESIELHRTALELRPRGHLHRSSTLYELALCMSNKHDAYGVADDLEEAVTLGREALELRPSGHPSRGESLHNLSCDLRKRFVKRAAIDDLEESIELHCVALELRPPGHPEQPSTLRELALCLSNRHDKLGVVDDLEEAVTLGREALECCPSGHPGHGKSLQCLAHDLRKRFEQTTVIGDLEESIELLHPALELCPIGHPDRSSLLHELALCLSHRHDKRGVADDLEEAILRGRAALELCPPGHPDRGLVLYSCACDYWKKFQYLLQAEAVVRAPGKVELASSLFELSQHFWDQFQKQKVTVTDLDHSIYLATYALELRLPPEDVSVAAWVQRLAEGENSDEPVMLEPVVDNLRALANYHRARFQAQHAIIDLDEAIAFYRHMLRFRPAGHPDRASSLHDLACCLADQFREQPAETDLNEAITLEREALELVVRGVPDYHVYRRCLTACLKMGFDSEAAMMSSGALGVTHFDVKQVIRKVAFETLKTLPTRLLYTPSGRICNRDEQISHFLHSQECKQLESSCTTYDQHQQMELIRIDISRHFEYVTLSHRWDEDEPSLHDIEDDTIYDMPTEGGFGKLKAFCRVALELDYLWAWSDTCCIDKDSSAEVQETIGSMFAWYRKSALTIVHLSDVTDTASLGGSEWFRRGWTLQELLAPRNVVFYTENWSLYKNLASSNHKMDIAVLAELENETGIDRRFLTNFSPGLDDARSRLQWASLRRTTRPEDIAYSLFGVFNLHLPVMYGESAENALGRLLAEIVSQSGDISVLDWIGEPSPFHSCFPAHIISYRRLPAPTSRPNTEEQSLASGQQPTLFKVLQKLCVLFATSLLPHFLSQFLLPSSADHRTSLVQRRSPDSYASSEVYDFYSLARVPLPRFSNRLLALPCIAYHVTTVQLKGENLSIPNYTYNIQASGLMPLEITLPTKLENVTLPQGVLHVVRPWHSKLLGPSAGLDAVTEQQLLSALGSPFNALLLTQLPHNEHKRIASSTLITAQPIGRANILNSKIRIFNVV